MAIFNSKLLVITRGYGLLGSQNPFIIHGPWFQSPTSHQPPYQAVPPGQSSMQQVTPLAVHQMSTQAIFVASYDIRWESHVSGGKGKKKVRNRIEIG